MIVWINGAFGAGKTTTAALLAARIPEAKIFDPEYVGYLLTTFVPAPTGDFQDLPLWRHLVVETMSGLAQHYPHPWIAPMSLIDAGHRAEILDGIRKSGAEVREFVLAVPEPQLRARIAADQIEAKAAGWRQDHVAQALTTFADLTDADFVDGTVPAEQVAATILARR
ncbi:AAA family ATPase [Paractinoplanes rishiriensis]|uniref:AAA family ATPase n=1 Tax=Paractinoplanes rishiriensis TaxID=1050105 RepID=UPI0019456209|nr:AAA family ATPase [Actinoplanes rishiriensis]